MSSSNIDLMVRCSTDYYNQYIHLDKLYKDFLDSVKSYNLQDTKVLVLVLASELALEPESDSV